jgi:two-component system, sensor histidine kinase and response regulator
MSHFILDFEQLLSTRFSPRGECGEWVPGYAWLYVISSILIMAAYVTIFALIALAYLQGRTSKAPVNITRRQVLSMRITYAAFILFCGIGHLEGVMSFFTPQYHLYAVWHAMTAVASWAAVFVTAKLRNRLIPGV